MKPTHYKVPIEVIPYPDGCFGVRSPLFPELLSEGKSVDEAVENARDAFEAVLELYQDLGKEIPAEALVDEAGREPLRFDLLAKSA